MIIVNSWKSNIAQCEACLVVEDGQAGLVMVLLQPLHRQPGPVLHVVQPTLQPAAVVIGLSSPRFASPAPECLSASVSGL